MTSNLHVSLAHCRVLFKARAEEHGVFAEPRLHGKHGFLYIPFALFFFGRGKKAHLTAFCFDDFGKTQHNASYWAFGIDVAVEELRRGVEQEVE